MHDTLILGAGLAGLAVSYHKGHARCLLLEADDRPFGHIKSHIQGGFTWDEGPHVSFTRHEYVRALFADSVGGGFEEFAAKVGNYFEGHWLDHPAQVALHQVPEPLRSRCVESFLAARQQPLTPPANYAEWLVQSLGREFAETFPFVYTEKYWTVPAHELVTEWVGPRMHVPRVEDVVEGAKRSLGRNLHYITTFRYPSRGGYQSFAEKLRQGANIRTGSMVSAIDLAGKKVTLRDGTSFAYQQLVSTIPLPDFVRMCRDVPEPVRAAAAGLQCSQVVLVNVAAPHASLRPESWLYVYDRDKLSTRISIIEHLARGNAPAGSSGIQTEVYFGPRRPLDRSLESIGTQVMHELVEMGLLRSPGGATVTVSKVDWANVIFTHETKPALDLIWSWLGKHGLRREADDLHPLTTWEGAASTPGADASLAFAGRFAQWKYFWTDDCVLRGRSLGGVQ